VSNQLPLRKAFEAAVIGALLSTHMLSFTSLVNTLPVLLPSVLGQVMEKHRARRVHVDERGVSIDERVRLARSNIVSSYLEPLGKSVLVKLQTRFDPVAFAAEADEEMGQRILHVLGQHAAQRRVLFHGKAIFMRFSAWHFARTVSASSGDSSGCSASMTDGLQM